MFTRLLDKDGDCMCMQYVSVGCDCGDDGFGCSCCYTCNLCEYCREEKDEQKDN